MSKETLERETQRLGLDKSSVFRALNTLKFKHYVRQDPDTLRYSNSYKLFEMGHNVVRETGLTKAGGKKTILDNHTPIPAKNNANRASHTMTIKMASTTACVVSLPTDSALPVT